MTELDLAHRRLHNQSITPTGIEPPEEVVKRLGALQAQDYLGALWAVGLRLNAATETANEDITSYGGRGKAG